MARLLIVTDHRFYAEADQVFDTYCFDRGFFQDYRDVFEEVVVAARVQLCTPPTGASRSDGDGVSFVALPDHRGLRWSALMQIRPPRSLRRAIGEADAVCVRLPAESGVVGARLARSLGKPVMFELIGDPRAALSSREVGALTGLVARVRGRQTSRIVGEATAGTYVSRNHLQERYPASATAVTDSVSSIRLPVESLRSHVGSASPHRAGSLRVVVVASLVPVKRHLTIIRALHVARNRGCDVSLDIIGEGPCRPAIARLAARLGIDSAVSFHGHVADADQLDALLDRADVFVLTSASEGMPRAMIESMAVGLPAIGTDVGGIAELLTSEQVVAVDDFEALGDLMADLSLQPDRLARLSKHSEAVAHTFTADQLSVRRRAVLEALRTYADRLSP